MLDPIWTWRLIITDGGADIIVVDTMPSDWYKKGHIKGAINFPWREPLGEPVNLPRTC